MWPRVLLLVNALVEAYEMTPAHTNAGPQYRSKRTSVISLVK